MKEVAEVVRFTATHNDEIVLTNFSQDLAAGKKLCLADETPVAQVKESVGIKVIIWLENPYPAGTRLFFK